MSPIWTVHQRNSGLIARICSFSDSTNRPGEYRSFDSITKEIRNGIIKGSARKYFDHLKAQKMLCENLVTAANEKASGLEMTHNGINNEVNKIKAQRKAEGKEKTQQVSPAESSNPPPKSTTPRAIPRAVYCLYISLPMIVIPLQQRSRTIQKWQLPSKMNCRQRLIILPSWRL